MSKSASLPVEPFDNASTADWKQEVNQRLAAHRNRRGNTPESGGNSAAQGTRAASSRAAEAAARVAARYAKAPSYSQLLAGEARAAVRAAGAAAEAALSAQAAAQAVLDGLESRPLPPHLWQSAQETQTRAYQDHTPQDFAHQETAHAASARWQDEPPVQVEEELTAPAAPIAPTISTPQAAAQPQQAANPWAGAQPRWAEELTPPGHQDIWSEMRVHPSPEPVFAYQEESRAYSHARSYDEPQAYRRNRGSEPVFYESRDENEHELSPYDTGATVEPIQHLPANLIEFPRELVATRKARPRLIEGPLYDPQHDDPQLSIFEVHPESLSDAPAAVVDPPGWASIELDHPAEPAYPEDIDYQDLHAAQAYAHLPVLSALTSPAEDTHTYGIATMQAEAQAAEYTHSYAYESAYDVAAPAERIQPAREMVRESVVRATPAPPELLVATFSDRLLATVVDGALVTLAFLAAAVVVIASTSHPPTGRIALIASGCGIALFWVLYQYLFLSYAEEGTPGMRYARIALCTFDDENPTLEQMRMRIPAMVVAALPAGLGLVWALWDKEHMGWQDRLTKTYQRKY